MSISTDYNAAVLENCISAINQLRVCYNDYGASQLFDENRRALKLTCQSLHLSTKPIDYEADRLILNDHYNINVYVMYNGKLPDVIANEQHLLLTREECIQRMRHLLMDCGYRVHTDSHKKTFWLYDIRQHKVLRTMDDYLQSLFLAKDFDQYEAKFQKALAKRQAQCLSQSNI